MTLTPEALRVVSKLVAEMVELRLDAGDHPEDVAISAWDMYETLGRVSIDGSWPSR